MRTSSLDLTLDRLTRQKNQANGSPLPRSERKTDTSGLVLSSGQPHTGYLS
jgi:hypothetical protein